MKILLVEDSQESIDSCIEYAEMYVANGKKIDIVVAHDLTEAFQQLKEVMDIDVAIVDIKLGDSQKDGNDVINEIQKLCLRIPTVAHTGTPDDVKADVLKTFVRAEDIYSNIFDYLLGVYNTGITEILGKTGLIESTVLKVYQKGLIPSLNKWSVYGNENPENTKKALLRYTINYLYELLDEETEKYYPEEVYIRTLDDGKLATGCILTKDNQNYFIVLSPACDLTIRKNGDYKTDSILLVDIEESKKIIDPVLEEIKNVGKKNDRLEKFYTNTETLYYHWLPHSSLFKGGIINFRKVESVSKESISDYTSCNIKVSPYFIKDIVSRFSSYYARQGQPEIYNDEFLLRDEKNDK